MTVCQVQGRTGLSLELFDNSQQSCKAAVISATLLKRKLRFREVK